MKHLLRAAALLLCLALVPLPAGAELPRVGVCVYSSRDTFIYGLVSEIRRGAQGKAKLDIRYAEGSQNTQNDQVLALLDDGVDVLVVNAVDRVSAVYLVRLCRQRGVPVVFINREPLKDDLQSYASAYYVGVDPRQQGRLQGGLAAQYFAAHPEADRNGDGIIQLVLLRGEPGHQDAELRSLYSLSALREEGWAVQKLQEETASWDRGLGQERMAQMLNALGGRIELVLSNNDDMALGAIDALKAAGYFGAGPSIPVIGVDATAPALEYIEQGSLYATVQNDAVRQAQAVVDLLALLAAGQSPAADNYPHAMQDRVVYVESEAVLRDGPG